MSPADGALAGSGVDHVALSVADLGSAVAFYAAVGLESVRQTDFAPAPVRSAILRNRAGLRLEIIEHRASTPTPRAGSPMQAALRQGYLHLALRVVDVTAASAAIVAAGGTLVSPVAPTSTGESVFAYVADPEGNLVELVAAANDSASAA